MNETECMFYEGPHGGGRKHFVPNGAVWYEFTDGSEYQRVGVSEVFTFVRGPALTTGTCLRPTLRRFVLRRTEDATGTSGVGVVAEGVEFSNGQVSLHWITQLESVAVYANVKVLEAVHGHSGRTVVEWVDE